MSKRKLIVGSSITIILVIISVVLGVTLYEKDISPPTIEISNPLHGDILSGTVQISLIVEDDISPQDKVEIKMYIDDILVTTLSSFEWITTEYSEGKHTITVEATDRKDNTRTRSIDVIVDNEIYTPSTDYFKIMTYNVKESGADPEWKDVVKEENADIIIFVETGDWDNSGNRPFYDYLVEFNDYFLYEAPYRGYTTQRINYDTSGEAIFSRYPILEFTQISELILDNEDIYFPTHDFIHAVVDIAGLETHIIGYHLKCCEGEFEEQRREWEQEGIINYMDGLGEVPLIYAGDLNSHSPEDVGELAPIADLGVGPMTMMLNASDPIYGQYASSIHNFTDVFRTLNPDNPGYSYGPENPSYIGRIDYIIVNQFFEDKLINSTTGDTLSADVGSDHYSVDAFIRIEESQELKSRNLEETQNRKDSVISTIKKPISFEKIMQCRKTILRNKKFAQF